MPSRFFGIGELTRRLDDEFDVVVVPRNLLRAPMVGDHDWVTVDRKPVAVETEAFPDPVVRIVPKSPEQIQGTLAGVIDNPNSELVGIAFANSAGNEPACSAWPVKAENANQCIRTSLRYCVSRTNQMRSTKR